MATNLSRRVSRLEEETVGHGRTLHIIDLPHGYDADRALDDLGVERKEDDLVVILGDPTGGGGTSADAKPRHLYSMAIATGRR